MFLVVGNALALAGQEARIDHIRPYSNDSPWNLKIGPSPVYDRHSETFTNKLSGDFGIDHSRFTMPVYIVSDKTPMRSIALSGIYSDVTRDGRMLMKQKQANITVPLPPETEPAAGTDAQIILWNPVTGDEWGFWRVKKTEGEFEAVNGYHYNTQWSGVCPYGFISRGAGTPYLVGLIRRWEVEQGRIEHAIALGVNYPSRLYVYPATKSDGKGLPPDLPSGARLQLDPSLTDEDFDKWGLDRTGRIIARALQEYGMIVIDSSGHPKLYAEYDGTANWGEMLHKNTVRNIPYSAFEVLDLATPPTPSAPAHPEGKVTDNAVNIVWGPSESATRYTVRRQGPESKDYITIAENITTTTFTDNTVKKGESYSYIIHAINYNGVSRKSRRVNVLIE